MKKWLSRVEIFFSDTTTRRAILIILVIGIVIFFNSLFNGFVGDDQSQTIDNTLIHSVRNIPAFFGDNTFYNGGSSTFNGGYYRPLVSTFFSIIYSIFGANPFWSHLFDVITYILGSILLFLFLRRFFRKSWALVLSSVFLVHPINSEVVFSISSTQDVLFLFFGILALWMLVNFKSKKFLTFSFLSLFLSLLSKETGLLFILIAVIYTIIFDRKRIYTMLIGSVITVSAYFGMKSLVVGLLSNSVNAPIARLNIWHRSLNIPEILLFYVKTFFFPLNLSSSYQWVYTKPSFVHFFLPIIILLSLLAIIIYFGIILYKKHPRPYFKSYVFFGSWFVLGLGFHSQIIPLDATVADRWFYFSIIGALGLIATLVEIVPAKILNKWAHVIVPIILLLLSARTFARSFDWRDEFALDIHDIKYSPDAYDLENAIGYILFSKGELEEGKKYLERSIATYPYLTNYNNLGLVYLQLGDYKEARQAYLNALKFGDYYITYENIAGLDLIDGDPNQSILFIKDAVNKFPQDSRLWLFLSILEYKNNYPGDAKMAISQAYKLDPNQPNKNVYEAIINNKFLNLEFNRSSR
jgi:protein O-mannosyl-transferase